MNEGAQAPQSLGSQQPSSWLTTAGVDRPLMSKRDVNADVKPLIQFIQSANIYWAATMWQALVLALGTQQQTKYTIRASWHLHSRGEVDRGWHIAGAQ